MELELLYQALRSERGIVIWVSDFKLAQQKLYAARRKSGDSTLDRLQLRSALDGNPNHLWIIKGAPQGKRAD